MTEASLAARVDKIDEQLESVVASAHRVGYAQAIADFAEALGPLSLKHPAACIELYDTLKALHAKASGPNDPTVKE